MEVDKLKSATKEIKEKLYYEGLAAYTYATIQVPGLFDGLTCTIDLEPDDFTAKDNSYTVNGGFDFPIGNVISKGIKLSISKASLLTGSYDWNKAVITLKTALFPDGTGNPSTVVKYTEGKFYANDVKINPSNIQITAYDAVSVLDTPYYINNANPNTHVKIYDTLWDYFVHLCDDVYREKLGEEEVSGIHWYSGSFGDIINSGFSLDAIETDADANTTLRDIFGYIAMLAGGNIVLDGNQKIKIIKYSLDRNKYICGLTFDKIVSMVYFGDEFGTGSGETISDNGIDFSSLNSFPILDKYVSPPTLEYNDMLYSKVTITYPRPNTKNGSATGYISDYESNPDYNPLSLYNPLCQKTNDSDTTVVNAAKNIHSVIPHGTWGDPSYINRTAIKPFSGSFMCNPLLEFMDSVIVIDINGEAYLSFVGEHTMNYLGASDISNHTPSVGRNQHNFTR